MVGIMVLLCHAVACGHVCRLHMRESKTWRDILIRLHRSSVCFFFCFFFSVAVFCGVCTKL